ncbi:MAG: ChaN family lipoprotein [Bacteroidota bacterium]
MRCWQLFILSVIALNSVAQLTEQNYRIYSVKLAKEVAISDIVNEMNNQDVLFYGEEHNDSVTHYLEHKIFEALHLKFASDLVLSMEMFERDVQPVMNEYLTSDIREKNFKKDARAWSNYKDYRPMVEFCKANRLDVICANAAGRYSNLAGRKGQKGLMTLPEDSKKYFAPLPYDTASGKYYEKLMGLFEDGNSRKKKQSRATGETFSLIMAQSLWDATMAYSISEYLQKHAGVKVFQVNGRFHSDEHFAAATQLKKYNPQIRCLVISSGSDEKFPNIDWKKYEYLGDYIIITDPKVPKTYKD